MNQDDSVQMQSRIEALEARVADLEKAIAERQTVKVTRYTYAQVGNCGQPLPPVR